MGVCRRHAVMTLDELVAGYAAATGCRYTAEKDACQATLTVEGLEIQAAVLRGSGMLVLQTGVALLPVHGREAFCLQLLAANNLFSQTLGLALGVDTDLELVTLQVSWELAALDEERFARLMGNLLVVASDWMVRLDAWRPDESAANTSEAEGEGGLPFELQFLRV